MKRICKDCGNEFEIKESEIGFYKSKGLELPKRCKECRNKNKEKTNSSTTTKTDNHHSASHNKTSSFNVLKILLIALISIVLLITVSLCIKQAHNTNYTEAIDASNTYFDSSSTLEESGIIPLPSESNSSIEAAKDEQAEVTEEIYTTDTDNTNDSDDTDDINNIGDSDNTEILEGSQESSQNTTEQIEPIREEPAPVTATYHFKNQNRLNEHYEKHGIEMGFDSAASYEAAASAVITNPAALNKIESEDGDFVYYLEETNEFVILSTEGYIRTYFLPSAGKAYYDRQ